MTSSAFRFFLLRGFCPEFGDILPFFDVTDGLDESERNPEPDRSHREKSLSRTAKISAWTFPSLRQSFLSKFGESLSSESASLSDYAPKLGSKTRQQGCSKIGAIRSELSSILHNFSTVKFSGIPKTSAQKSEGKLHPTGSRLLMSFGHSAPYQP
jgi:hypothetical protein